MPDATKLNREQMEIRRTNPDDPAAQAAIGAYSRFLAGKIPDEGPEPLALPMMGDAERHRPPQGAVLVAFSDGAPVGAVSLRSLAPGLGEIKRLWVVPEARGLGLARRLMRDAEDQARALGMTRLKLDTNHALTEALALYRADGWVETEPYSDYPATRWFTKVL